MAQLDNASNFFFQIEVVIYNDKFISAVKGRVPTSLQPNIDGDTV